MPSSQGQSTRQMSHLDSLEAPYIRTSTLGKCVARNTSPPMSTQTSNQAYNRNGYQSSLQERELQPPSVAPSPSPSFTPNPFHFDGIIPTAGTLKRPRQNQQQQAPALKRTLKLSANQQEVNRLLYDRNEVITCEIGDLKRIIAAMARELVSSAAALSQVVIGNVDSSQRAFTTGKQLPQATTKTNNNN